MSTQLGTLSAMRVKNKKSMMPYVIDIFIRTWLSDLFISNRRCMVTLALSMMAILSKCYCYTDPTYISTTSHSDDDDDY